MVSDIFVSYGYIYFREVHGYMATNDDNDTTQRLLSWKGIASMYGGDVKRILVSREDYGHIFRVKVCATKIIDISETINSSETPSLDLQVLFNFFSLNVLLNPKYIGSVSYLQAYDPFISRFEVPIPLTLPNITVGSEFLFTERYDPYSFTLKRSTGELM